MKVLASNTILVELNGRPGCAIELFGCQEDKVKPFIAVTQPTKGSTITQNRPVIVVRYYDSLSGINLRSLSIKVNGVDKTRWFTKTETQATWQTTPLPEGRNTVIARIADKAGNYASDTCTFIVQTHPVLSLTITSPSKDTLVNHSPIVVTYIVNGIAHSRSVNLVEGMNRVIIDTVVRFCRAADTVRVTLDTKPPVVVITSPADGFHTDNPYLTISWTVDGVAFTKDTILTLGKDTITRTAVDAAGNIGSGSVTVTLEPPKSYKETVPSAAFIKPVAVENPNDTANFSGAFLYPDIGKPGLPYYKVSFLVPPGTNLDRVTITLNDTYEQYYAGEYIVKPFMPPFDTGGRYIWPKGKGIDTVTGRDTVAYGTDAYYPASYIKEVRVGKMRQYKIVDVVVMPYQWNPVTHRLRAISGGKLSLSSSVAGGDSLHGIVRDNWAEQQFASQLVNSEVLSYYGFEPSVQSLRTTATLLRSAPALMAGAAATGLQAGMGYAIITTKAAETEPCGQPIRDYIDILKAKGVNVYTLFLDSAFLPTADARANFIRGWLHKNYLSPSNPPDTLIHYVLLIGEPHPDSGTIPMKKWWGTPTDFYYAELSDSSGIIDDRGDVAVGRIPSDPEHDTSNLIAKYFARAVSYINETNTDWRRFALVPIAPLEGGINKNSAGESLKKDIFDPAQWQSFRVYSEYNFVVYEGRNFDDSVINMNPLAECITNDYEFGFSNVMSAWNRYHPGIVSWLSHGCSAHSWAILSRDYVDASLDSGNATFNSSPYTPAMVFQSSCDNADPYYSYNFAEAILTRNAITTVASTVPAGTSLQQPYTSLIAENFPCGVALNMAQHQASLQMNFNLFGLPEVSINVWSPASGAPLPPRYLVARGSSKTEINLSWQPVSGATGYVIERGDSLASRGGGFSLLVSIAGQTATNYTDATCSPGTKYKYRVRAENTGVPSWYSNIDSSSTFDGAGQKLYPDTPANVSISAHDHRAIITCDPAARATSYNIKRSISPNGPFVTIAEDTNKGVEQIGGDTCKYLLNGTTYYFVVSAVNEWGESGNSSIDSVMPIRAAVPTPQNLRYTALGPTSITLLWDGDLSGITVGYEIERMDYDNLFGTGYGEWHGDGKEPYYNLGHGESSLENGASYKYRVRGYGDPGYYSLGYSNELEVTTLIGNPPAVPDSFRGEILSPELIRLSWKDTATMPPKATSFQIFWRYNGGTFNRDFVANTPDTFYNFYASANSILHFRIRSVYTESGQDPLYSSLSNTITDTTPPWQISAPFNLTAKGVSLTSVLLAWQDTSGMATGFVLERMSWRDTGYTVWTVIDTTGPTDTSYADAGLIDRVCYYYRVKALCSAWPGFSAYAYSERITPGQAVAPELSVTGLSLSSVMLSWIDSSGGSASGFNIERSKDNGASWAVLDTIAGNATSYQDNGLTDTISYGYRVQALFPSGGHSFYSEIAWITTGKAIAPELSVTGLSLSSVMLRWIDNSGGSASGFNIERSKDNGASWAVLDTVAGNATSYQDNGLTDTISYGYRVQALFPSKGHSFYSDPAWITLREALTPSNLTADIADSHSVDLNWTDNSGSSDTGFVIERADSWNKYFQGTWNVIDTVRSHMTGYHDIGLMTDTVYSYRVCALWAGGSGRSGYSNYVPIQISAPGAPSLYGSSPYSTNAVHLEFQWSSYAKAMGFRIERATDSAGPFDTISTFPWGGTIGYGGYMQDSSFIDNGLSPNTVYYYRAYAYNVLGGTYSAAVPIKTLPAAPQNLMAVQVARTSARLSWSSGQNGTERYQIRRAIAGSFFSFLGEVDSTVTTFTDTGLTPGTTYNYIVYALNTSGASAPSDTATVKMLTFAGPIKSVAAGGNHSLILKTDGTLWACGSNWFGALGDGTTTERDNPVPIMSGVQSIAAGYAHTLILKTDGTLFACGYNGYGQLGDGTTTQRDNPMPIMTGVQAIAAGGDHSMILKTDTLWVCGNNGYGQLGDGTTTQRDNPVPIMTGVQAIAAGSGHSLILMTNGTLFTCGRNDMGQLGDGTTTERDYPVYITTGVQAIAAGEEYSLILKSDGTLFACGDNDYGQLGDGTTTQRDNPVPIMTGVQAIAAGHFHSLILKGDGTLFACGYNGYGGLGDGTTTQRDNPVPIMTGVQAIAAGSGHSLILMTNGTLFACGYNYQGQLGDGTTTERHSPVQISF